MIQFDCHAHVFEVVTAVPNARYVPVKPAPLSTWLGNLERHDLKGGVLVQVSFLGNDNSQLCQALAKLDRTRFAGVAVAPVTVDAAALEKLVDSGVRGLRWNLVGGGPLLDLSSPESHAFFKKLRALNLHLEVHLEGPRLAQVLPRLLDQGIPLVVDHFGLPSQPDPRLDPLITSLSEISDKTHLFFKFSAFYRTDFDLTRHAEVILYSVGEKNIVWGSDWPHTQHEAINYTDSLKHLSGRIGSFSDAGAVHTLYGL